MTKYFTEIAFTINFCVFHFVRFALEYMGIDSYWYPLNLILFASSSKRPLTNFKFTFTTSVGSIAVMIVEYDSGNVSNKWLQHLYPPKLRLLLSRTMLSKTRKCFSNSLLFSHFLLIVFVVNTIVLQHSFFQM